MKAAWHAALVWHLMDGIKICNISLIIFIYLFHFISYFFNSGSSQWVVRTRQLKYVYSCKGRNGYSYSFLPDILSV